MTLALDALAGHKGPDAPGIRSDTAHGKEVTIYAVLKNQSKSRLLVVLVSVCWRYFGAWCAS